MKYAVEMGSGAMILSHPIVAPLHLHGNMFTESLPSSWYTCHNIYSKFYKDCFSDSKVNRGREIHSCTGSMEIT
jgi:hypothetical protein